MIDNQVQVRETNMTTIQPTDKRELQYIYQDGDGYVFLDVESDAPITLPRESAGALAPYLREGSRICVHFCDGEPVGLEAPAAVELAVTDTEPPRNSCTSGLQHKPATLETGLRLMIPAFVDVGETVVVDPRSGAYVGRAAMAKVTRRNC
jgi:elongation factor P